MIRERLFPEPWMRWYDLPVLRRIALARFSFMRKAWHPEAKRLARFRALYWVLIRGHDTEICARHGGPVGVVFHVPDDLWERYSGWDCAGRSPDGEAGCGVLCPECFSDLYAEAVPGFLRWTCAEDDSVLTAPLPERAGSLSDGASPPLRGRLPAAPGVPAHPARSARGARLSAADAPAVPGAER